MADKLTREQAEELRSLASRLRRNIRVEDVYEASRRPESALHSWVGWDRKDSDLACKMRMDRARLALAALKLRADETILRRNLSQRNATAQEKLIQQAQLMERRGARQFIKLTGTPGYCDILKTLEKPDGARRVRMQLLGEVEAFVRTRLMQDATLQDFFAAACAEARKTFLAP